MRNEVMGERDVNEKMLHYVWLMVNLNVVSPVAYDSYVA